MTTLAQIEIPDIVFAAVAPELVLTGVALLLLVLAVGGRARTPFAVTGGIGAVALGVWLLFEVHTAPGIIVVALGAISIAAAVGMSEEPALAQAWIAEAALVAALALTVWQWMTIYVTSGAGSYLAGAVTVDGVALFTRITVLVSALLIVPIGYGYLRDRGIYRLEYEPLILLSVIGMTILGAAGDLLVVFIAIELLSFPLYILAGLARRDRRSQEASMKYFIVGAVAAAVLVYGVALIYTATGTVSLALISDGLALVSTPVGVALLGAALITVGLAFKAAAAPFHFWTPDVYQGSPTNVTAFMAAATKAAAFAVLLRVFIQGFGRLEASWVPVLAGVAAVSMLLGAIAAIVQRDVKRVLAYSSIAHVGYALVGVTSGGAQGLSSTLWYLLTYAVTAIGAFACVVAIERRRRGEVALVDLRGLGRRAPVLSGVFGLCLLSLAGIPATAGFTGKFAVFSAGVGAGLAWLVVIGVVSSVIAAFFYLRLIGAMFLEEPDEAVGDPIVTTGFSVGLALAAAGVVYLGIFPQRLVELAQQAATVAR